jgi:hypothetical protein
LIFKKISLFILVSIFCYQAKASLYSDIKNLCGTDGPSLAKLYKKRETEAKSGEFEKEVADYFLGYVKSKCPEGLHQKTLAEMEKFKIQSLVNRQKALKKEMARVASFRPPLKEWREFEELSKNLGMNANTEISPAEIERLMVKGRESMLKRKESCSSVDNRKPPLVEMKNGKIVRNIMRDQDSTGYCSAYTVADLFSHRLGKSISAVDLANTYYQDQGADSSGWSDFAKSLSELSSSQAVAVIRKSMEKGFCLEKDLPSSDFKFSQVYSSYLDQLKSLEELHNSYQEGATRPGLLWGRRKKSSDQIEEFEQTFKEKLSCSSQFQDLKALFPSLKVEQLMEILHQSSTAKKVLDQLMKFGCRQRVKVKLNFHSSIDEEVKLDYSSTDPHKRIEKMDVQLGRGNIVGISYNPDIVTGSREDNGSHASSIVARTFNTSSGACEYLIRNSWGTGCHQYQASLRCEEGNIWITEEKLATGLYGVFYVE